MKALNSTIRSVLVLTLLATQLMACSSDDDGTTVQSPSVDYGSTTVDVQFFTAGNSGAPQTNWNGNQGSFALITALEGLSINSSTGAISWTKDLATGSHAIQVRASNSAGQTTINLTIVNPFQGVFTGTYAYLGADYYLQYQFNEDGSMVARANDPANPLVGEGTWTKSGNTILMEYTDHNGFGFTASGSLNLSGEAVLSGNWTYYDGSSDSFEMTLE